MSANSARFATVLVAAVMLFAVLEVRGFQNPDWFAYMSIYEDQGAWLRDQNRDPLFLWLNNTYHAWAGIDSYEQFRNILSACFVIFTVLLMRRRIIPFARQHVESIVIALAVLSLLLLKFTVQIREGLALTFVLIAIGQLTGVRGRTIGQGAPRVAVLWKSLPWLVTASLLHFGAAYHLLLVLIAAARVQRTNEPPVHFSPTVRSMPSALIVLLGLGIAVVISVGTSLPDGQFSTIYGDTLLEQTEIGWGKVVYWCLYGALIAAARGGIKELQIQLFVSPVYREYVGLLGRGLAPAIYVASLILLVLGSPSPVTSAANRLLMGVLTLILVLIAMHTRRRRVVILGSAFLLVDQIRIMAAALVTTYGEGF